MLPELPGLQRGGVFWCAAVISLGFADEEFANANDFDSMIQLKIYCGGGS